MNTRLQLGVAILAAGMSSRMGRPKLLLRWGDGTVIEHLISQWQAIGAAQTGIVISPEATELNAELDRLHFPVENRILNSQADCGMFSSIQCAARWNGWSSSVSHFVITLGDQPHLKKSTLDELVRVAAASPDNVVQPLRNGRRRHPVILPRSVFMQLRASSCSTLKEFLVEQPFHGSESEDAGLDLDMDTPEDYQRLLRLHDGAAD